MKTIKKEIKFDGSKFWLGEQVIHEVEEELKFQDFYEADFINEQKDICIGKIMSEDIA